MFTHPIRHFSKLFCLLKYCFFHHQKFIFPVCTFCSYFCFPSKTVQILASIFGCRNVYVVFSIFVILKRLVAMVTHTDNQPRPKLLRFFPNQLFYQMHRRFFYFFVQAFKIGALQKQDQFFRYIFRVWLLFRKIRKLHMTARHRMLFPGTFCQSQ